MPETLPAWLAAAIPNAHDGHARLAAAKFAGEGTVGKGGFKLSSAAFADGGALDPCFTADEDDAVAPPLEWTAPPPGTQEMVLVVEDADARPDKPLTHWLVWGLAPQRGQLLEGEVPPRVGKNAQGNSEWLLPNPPTGAQKHEYLFQLFALDLPLVLMPGATREDLFAELDGHVLAVALLSGTYMREEGGEYDWDDEDEDAGE